MILAAAAAYILAASILLFAPIPLALALFLALAVTPGLIIIWISTAIALDPNTGPGRRGRHSRFLLMTEQKLLAGSQARHRKPKGAEK